MKYLKITLYLALVLLTPVLALATPKLATVQVKITGLNNNHGVVRIAMFATPQTFAEKNNSAPDAFQKGVASINDRNEAIYTFKNVPYGIYAIKLFHDEDNSGNLKKNFFGKPQEEFGFSNNPPITNQAPSFDHAKFAVNQSKVTMTIRVDNP